MADGTRMKTDILRISKENGKLSIDKISLVKFKVIPELIADSRVGKKEKDQSRSEGWGGSLKLGFIIL